MDEHRVIFVIVVFLGTFFYIQTLFGTEFFTSNMASNYSAQWNGTPLYSNLSSSGGGGAIPQPPVCTAGVIIVDGALGCGAGYVSYFWDLLTFRSDIAWVNILFLIPMLVIVGLVVVNLIIRIADLIPFT